MHEYGAAIKVHPFENHPKQWHAALKAFSVTTPWVVCLDADQYLSPELYQLLHQFNSVEIPDAVTGIYFNRKNFFRGKWIRFGGYFPKYMLKMFRYGIGYSDLSEHMDHRFVAPGASLVWKKGYLVEENLKENAIGFWINKHNRYSDLLAQESFEKDRAAPQKQGLTIWLRGTPDEKIALLKSVWHKLPLYLRPFMYFFYRYFIRLGFLDGKQGFIFHFLQAFWFRLLVDIKIEELRKTTKD